MNALVTGASRGIGLVIAQGLAARGVRIAVHYQKNKNAADAALGSLAGTGHACFSADIGEPEKVTGLWNEVCAQFNRVDILVNNAGIYRQHPPLETGFGEWTLAWERTLAVNLLGPAHLCYFAGQAMAREGGGRIVNISSRGAFRGEPSAPAYGASKAGLNSVSQSLAKALAPQKVYVYCIAPGWVETEMAAEFINGPRGSEIRAQHPLGRVNYAEEVARTVVFCALDAPAAMTGGIIDVNGASYLRT